MVDLEMCLIPKHWRTAQYPWANETIQIGAVLMNEKFEIIDEFSTYVCPRLGYINSKISRLTGITKEDVKDAPDIKSAIESFVQWMPENAAMIAWSDSDRAQFQHEIVGKDLGNPGLSLLEKEWIDCQKIFDAKVGAENAYSLLNALNLSDIDYREDIHNGLTDAYNTALLYRKLITDPDYSFNSYYLAVEKDTDSPVIGNSLGSLLAGLKLDDLPE